MHSIIDIKKEKAGIDGKTWPQARRIINYKDGIATQDAQLKRWLQEVLEKFVNKRGSFKVDSKNNLSPADFFEVYDLIESVSRFDLAKLRKENEEKRMNSFQKAFFGGLSGDNLLQARKEYINAIQDSLALELQLYQAAQDKVLKRVKINDNIWNQSMDAYLPEGREYVINALKFTQSSPFTFSGQQNEDQVFLIFKEAVEFALNLVVDKKCD